MKKAEQVRVREREVEIEKVERGLKRVSLTMEGQHGTTEEKVKLPAITYCNIYYLGLLKPVNQYWGKWFTNAEPKK